MIVDLNSQTFSLRSSNILVKITVYVMMMALILAGAAPSFADERENSGESTETAASADIDWSDAPYIEGTSGIIMDAGSGTILYEKNAYERRDPASITKIMTSLITLETLDMDQEVTVPAEAVAPDDSGTNIDLKEGEVLTVEQLLYGMMLESGNDAADTLAIAISGSIESFAELMNERAAACGAEDTTFISASGLSEYGEDHNLTTAYDIAMIAREAMKNPEFRQIVSTARYTIPATNMSDRRTLRNTDVCLYEEDETIEVSGIERPFKYDGATGIKTGYTGTAGNCFCGSAQKDDTELIAVSLNSTSEEQRFADVMALWDYGFSKYYTYTAAAGRQNLDEFRVWQGEKSHVAVGISEDMDITLNEGYDSDNITVEAVKDDGAIKAPVEKGDRLGQLIAYDENGEAVATADLVAMESVEKGGILSYIGIADEDIIFFVLGIIGILILLILIRMLYVRSRRKKRKRRRAERTRHVRRKEWEKEKNPFGN